MIFTHSISRRPFINRLFNGNLLDIMSGFRIMNRDFVKNINPASSGFEIETEMTIKALKYGFVIKEIEVDYRERPAGSFSKLSTFKDGMLVLKTIGSIFRDYRPFFFFSIIALALFVISIASGSVVVKEFIETRYIKRVPLAIFASGSMIVSILSFVTGLVLDSINKRFDELHCLLRNRN